MDFLDAYPHSDDVSLQRERLAYRQRRIDNHLDIGYTQFREAVAKRRLFGCRPLRLDFRGISRRETGPTSAFPSADAVTAFLTRRQFFRTFSLEETLSKLFRESFVNLRSWKYERRGDIDEGARGMHDEGKSGKELFVGLVGAGANDEQIQSLYRY